MKHPEDAPRPIPLHDYGLALQSAVSWLGDRYLLASPVVRRNPERRAFFSEPRRWHSAPRRSTTTHH